MTAWLRTSIILGAAPLVVGSLLFALWVPLRWDGLAIAGLLTIFGGVVSVAVGLVCLLFHVKTPAPAGRSGRASLTAAALLLINFPVAAALVFAANDLETRYWVTVENDSTEPIDSFVLHGGGVRVDVGAIPAGANKRVSFHVRREGELLFEANTGRGKLEGVVDGYATRDLGAEKLIVIGPHGRVAIRDAGT